LPSAISDTQDNSNSEQEIILRLKGAFALASKIDPVKSVKGGGLDVDLSFTENLGITGTFFYLVGSDSSKNTSTNLTSDVSLKNLFFGVGPRYMIKKSNLRAYAGLSLGLLSVTTDLTTYFVPSSTTKTSGSATSFAYGPVFGIDFPIAGAFGLGMQIQYINSSKASFASAMGGFSLFL